ncbi:DegT/DnrJ/EryC1/StrS family aminotransferase [candidate division KSB1 bacterium]
MNVPFNDLKREYLSIKQEIDAAIREVIDNTAFIKGKYLNKFEEEFAAYCNTRYAVGASSGTTALHLAMEGFGIGKGDEVITVSHTFIGTTEPISHAGADITFIDIDPKTYTMNPSLIEALITSKTKAIVVVHLYGQMADMEAILKIARKHDLIVIEDAAQAVGARFNGNGPGFYGNAACFSFYPGKNLGAYGDGGAVVTSDEAAAMKMKMLADHGRLSKYLHDTEGYNYRLDSLQAAVLGVKLKYIDEWNGKRREVASFYNEHLKDLDMVLPEVAHNAEHIYHIYCVQVKDREFIQKRLKEKGVSSGIHYPVPLHLQPAYAHMNLGRGSLPETEQCVDLIMSLPIFPFITADELEHTAATLHGILRP